VSYYEDGETVWSREYYHDGKLHGRRTEYYASGRTKIVGYYSRGALDGTVTAYYPNGNKSTEVRYRNGEILGSVKRYDTSGTLFDRKNFVGQKKYGRYDLMGGVVWMGTTDETRGVKITKKEHDAEMKAFGAALEKRRIAWMIVAKRLGVSKDIARHVDDYVNSSGDFFVEYYREWLAEQ
jgi:hypothetical protein